MPFMKKWNDWVELCCVPVPARDRIRLVGSTGKVMMGSQSTSSSNFRN